MGRWLVVHLTLISQGQRSTHRRKRISLVVISNQFRAVDFESLAVCFVFAAFAVASEHSTCFARAQRFEPDDPQ